MTETKYSGLFTVPRQLFKDNIDFAISAHLTSLS